MAGDKPSRTSDATEPRSDSLDIVTSVASRLSDVELLKKAALAAVQQSRVPSLVQWQPHSIVQGSAGLAVLFGYLDDCDPGKGWDLLGKKHLQFVVESIEGHAGTIPPGLFGGLAGAAFAAWALSKSGSRYSGLLRSLDEALIPAISELLACVDPTERGVANHHFDAISGLAGIGVYCRCRVGDTEMRYTLEKIISCLIAISDEVDNLPRWHTPVDLIPDEVMAREFPKGNLNCGLAHGIPGPLAIMAVARTEGVDMPGLDEAIIRIADWLAEHTVNDQWGLNWPVAVSLEECETSQKSEIIRTPSRAAWCYGSPGVCRALYLAGVATERRDYCNLAVEGMKAVLLRPIKERRIASPTFCHGIAGLLQITLRFARDTGLPEFIRGVSELSQQLANEYEPVTLLGYRSIEVDGRRIDNPGLLDGAPGVALALLSASTNVEPDWDRLFLLS